MAESKEEQRQMLKQRQKRKPFFQKNSLLKARHLHSTEIY